jgi:glycine cleavage system H protein
MGITSVMEKILYEPFKISLPKTGSKLTQADDLGTIEGYKISADLISPVSGTVIQINDFLLTLMNQGTVLEPVINDPYNGGWMLVVELSKPDELKALLTAQSYRDLVMKK